MRLWIVAALVSLHGCAAPAPPSAGADAAPPASTSAAATPASVADAGRPAPASAAPASSSPGSAEEPKKPAAPAIYGTHTTLALTKATHGIDGALRVLEDTRARKPGGARPLVMRTEEGWLHARLELLDAAGRPIDARELWTSLADVRPAGALRGTFFLTLDPECFASKFCGADTEMVDVTTGKLAPVSSVDAETRRREPIRLRDSIVAGWRASPAERGAGFEIFQVTRGSAPAGAVTAYVRYTLEGDTWIKRYRQRAGEDPPGNPGNEEAAFDRSKFPQLPRGAEGAAR